MNFYNENDPKTAAWLRELIRADEIPDGIVDERSIIDLQPKDLHGFTQHHFFAGIGGWSLALRMVGWPYDRSVWTGSCPCQPYSGAGKGLGDADPRNLWPAFFSLIRQCRPERVYGEQVESAIGHGWLDGISADLETEGYACGATVLGAHSLGAPHPRQRLYWMGIANGDGWSQRLNAAAGARYGNPVESAGCNGRLEHATSNGREQRRAESSRGSVTSGCESCGMAISEHGPSGDAGKLGQPKEIGIREVSRQGARIRISKCYCSDGGMGNAASDVERRERESREGFGRLVPIGGSGSWSDYEIIPCRDGKSRRIESGTFPLAHGIPGRVGLLRGYGNAIAPEVAAAFIQASEEALADL